MVCVWVCFYKLDECLLFVLLWALQLLLPTYNILCSCCCRALCNRFVCCTPRCCCIVKIFSVTKLSQTLTIEIGFVLFAAIVCCYFCCATILHQLSQQALIQYFLTISHSLYFFLRQSCKSASISAILQLHKHKHICRV